MYYLQEINSNYVLRKSRKTIELFLILINSYVVCILGEIGADDWSKLPYNAN